MIFKPEDFRLPVPEFHDRAISAMMSEQIKAGMSMLIPDGVEGIRVYREDGELIGYFGRRCICCGGGGVNHDI